MTTGAGGAQVAAVGIRVAIAALTVREAAIDAVRVALGAIDLGVRPGELVGRRRVVKGESALLERRRGCVASDACGAESTTVGIFVTRRALR